MNQKKIWFVVVTYKPVREALRRLIATFQEWSTEVVDNTEKNLGYGGGANVGMKKAFDAGARWVVVVNQDVQVTRKGVTQFCVMLEQCEPGIVGPEAGSLDPKRWTTILPARGRVDYISGSFIAIQRKVWETTSGFYEPYFMYYEDADLCLRAKKAGSALQQVKIEGFRHESDASNASKEYYLARNHLLFVLRNAPLSVKLHELLRLPKTIWESLW